MWRGRVTRALRYMYCWVVPRDFNSYKMKVDRALAPALPGLRGLTSCQSFGTASATEMARRSTPLIDHASATGGGSGCFWRRADALARYSIHSLGTLPYVARCVVLIRRDTYCNQISPMKHNNNLIEHNNLSKYKAKTPLRTQATLISH